MEGLFLDGVLYKIRAWLRAKDRLKGIHCTRPLAAEDLLFNHLADAELVEARPGLGLRGLVLALGAPGRGK